MKLLNIRQYFIFLFLVLFSFTSILNLGASKNPDDELPGDVSDSSKTDLCKTKVENRYTNECIAKCEEKADYSTNCEAALAQPPIEGPPTYQEKPIVSEIKASLYKAMTDDSFELAGDAVLKTSLASIDVTFNSDTYEKFQKLLFVAESTNAEVGSMRSLKEETGTSSMSSFTKEQQKENAELVVKGIIIDSLVEDAKLPTGAGDSIKKAMKSLRDNWVNYMHKEGADAYGGETFFNTSSMEAMDTYSLAHHVYNAAKGIEAAMLKTTYPAYSAMTIAADEDTRNAVTLSVMQKDLRAALIDTLVVKATDAEWEAEKNYTFTVSIIDNTNTAFKDVDKLVVDVTALTTVDAWTPINKILNFDATGIALYTSGTFDNAKSKLMQESGYLALSLPTPEALFPMKALKKPGATADAAEADYTDEDKKKLSYMLMEKKAKVIQKKLYNLLRDESQTATIVAAKAEDNTLAKALFDQALASVSANATGALIGTVKNSVGATLFTVPPVNTAAAITTANLIDPVVVIGPDDAKILIFTISSPVGVANVTPAQAIAGLQVGSISSTLASDGFTAAAAADAAAVAGDLDAHLGINAAGGNAAAHAATAGALNTFIGTTHADVLSADPAFTDLPSGTLTVPQQAGAITFFAFYNLLKTATPDHTILAINMTGIPAQTAATIATIADDFDDFAVLKNLLRPVVMFANLFTTADTFDTLPGPMKALRFIDARMPSFINTAATAAANLIEPCYMPTDDSADDCFIGNGGGADAHKYAVMMGGPNVGDNITPTGVFALMGQVAP